MKFWRNCLLSKTASIYQAIENINKSGMQIALIVDDNDHLLGTITDGDIRRAILKKINLFESVERIMNRNPITVKKGQSKSEVCRLMRERVLHNIPVIDINGKVCGLNSFSNLIYTSKKDNTVVLMAGGLGTRLRPMTENCPKPMLKIGNKPILETIIESFIEYGFRKFYISVNYKSDVIENYFKNGSDYGVEIRYLRESNKMGTAGSLSLLPNREELPIIVMNGDILTKVDYESLLSYHMEENAMATMAVREYSVQIPYGVIDFDGEKILGIVEKPKKTYFVNAGIYVLNPQVAENIKKDRICDMPMVFNKLIRENQKTSIFPIKEYWLDIGRMDDYEKAQNDYINILEK